MACVEVAMDLRISSPCPMKWNDLTGNDRIRYCGQCKLNVYNLAEMPDAEVDALVRKTEGRLCVRLFLRGDRTATLRDCPTALKQRLMRRFATVGVVFFLGVFGWLFRGMEGPDRSRLPDWVRSIVNLIDPKPQPLRELMGTPCVKPTRSEN